MVFFSGWKQEAWLCLAAWLGRLLAAAAAQPGPLLSYVPTAYLDCMLDWLTSMRLAASEAAAGTALPPAATAPTVEALRAHGVSGSSNSSGGSSNSGGSGGSSQGSLGDLIGALVVLLHEPRICTPDAKEALVAGLGSLLGAPGLMAEVERNAVARARLAGAAVAAFDSRLWHPVAQVRGVGAAWW